MNVGLRKIQNQIDNYHKIYGQDASVGELSDGNHSFEDLYNHRTVLLALAMFHIPYAWKSKFHEDGSMYDNMFVAGFPTPSGMVSYHCYMEFWSLFKVPELPHAPHFDGYTDNDVLFRISDMLENSNNRLFKDDVMNSIDKLVDDYIIPIFDECEEPYIEKVKFLGSYFV